MNSDEDFKMSAQGTVEDGTVIDTGIWASYHLLLKTTWGKKRASLYIHNLMHSNLRRQRRWQTPLYQHRGMKTGAETWVSGECKEQHEHCQPWKNAQHESCELSFIWGKMSPTAWETAFQIALRKCSKEVGEKVSIYMILVKREYMWSSTDFLQKVSASLMKLSFMFSFSPLFSNSLESFRRRQWHQKPTYFRFYGLPWWLRWQRVYLQCKKEMATHSGILAWKIPWTEKAGGLQSMGLQKSRHDWVTNTFISIFITLTCGNTFIDASTYLKLKQTNRCSRWTQVFRDERWCIDMREEIQEFWLACSRSSGAWAASHRWGGSVWWSWEPSLILSDSDQGSCMIGATSHGRSPFAGTVYLSVCLFTYLATPDSVCTFIVFISCFI